MYGIQPLVTQPTPEFPFSIWNTARSVTISPSPSDMNQWKKKTIENGNAGVRRVIRQLLFYVSQRATFPLVVWSEPLCWLSPTPYNLKLWAMGLNRVVLGAKTVSAKVRVLITVRAKPVVLTKTRLLSDLPRNGI